MLHALRRLLPPVLPAALAAIVSLACTAPAQAQTTLLIPSRTSIEEKLATPSPKELPQAQQAQERKGQDAPKDAAREELKPKSEAKPDA